MEHSHLSRAPLHFFHNVQTGVDYERVVASGIFTEARHAVGALSGGSELVLEERVVLGAYYFKVEVHVALHWLWI